MKKLELRMYGLTPYNISPIQQGIQFGHAVVEYGQKMKYLGEHNQSLNNQYNDWADNWKTFIILNGGTSNHSVNRYSDSEDFFGSMENNLKLLEDNNIQIATFYEPDLNDMLSGIVFIVEERVFNKKDYPDFSDWLMVSKYADLIRAELGANVYTISENIKKSTNKEDQKAYKEWVDLVGGEKNVFLRDFLKNFRLA
jgi:flavodoxin